MPPQSGPLRREADAWVPVSAPEPLKAEPPNGLILSGYALVFWSLAFMLPHLHWALGGTWGLSTVLPSTSALPQWQMINWVASVVLLAAALLGWALVEFRHRRRSSCLLLAVAWAGCSIAIAHGLYGILSRVGTLSSLPEGTEPPGWLLWDLLVYEPWFLIEGILFGVTGRLLVRPAFRWRWYAACAAGIAFAASTAFMEVRVV